MKTFSSILIVAFLVSCQTKSEHQFEKLQKMAWIIGNWEQKLPEGTVTESWTKENDSTFLGKSYFIKDKDTLHLENIVLTQKNGQLLYIPTVNGQNNDEPVTFTMLAETENNFSFSNTTHDYPQTISYKKINDTNLVATLSGKQQGKESKESYQMTKQ